MIDIKAATQSDAEHIRAIYLAAFPDNERNAIADLAIQLLNEDIHTKSLVAEIDGVVVGHIAFSPVYLKNDRNWKGYILAPLCVEPEYQKRQVGTTLIESGMEQLTEMGVNILFVYGDPEYYGRFGFEDSLAVAYSPPYKLQYPFGWQAVNLNINDDLEKSAGKISCVEPLNSEDLW